ncbi:MAG: SRPBCC domain-containing protein, partial [Allosphingosinicella sp.]
TWHPYAVDPDKDYSAEPQMRVEFRLEPADEGTRLTVVESGFDALPAERRDEALRSNTGGWEEQMQNVKAHVER